MGEPVWEIVKIPPWLTQKGLGDAFRDIMATAESIRHEVADEQQERLIERLEAIEKALKAEGKGAKIGVEHAARDT